MRHRKKSTYLGKNKSSKKALLRTQAISLVKNNKIKTTTARAKALKSFIETLITKAKKGDLASEREVYKALNNKEATKKLLKTVAPRFKDKKGGYTRLTKLGYRKGDGASLSQIEIL